MDQLSMRLISYLQQQFQYPRRAITKAIDSGGVILNKNIVQSYTQVVIGGDQLIIKGTGSGLPILQHTISLDNAPIQDIICFHKPVGYVVSNHDPHNKTIYDILPTKLHSYQYIGRLDKESSGLLLLTNDRKLVHELSHPSKGVTKIYEVIIDTKLSDAECHRCIQGIYDEGELLKVVTIKQSQQSGGWLLRLTLIEGHKRHIRRMLKLLNKKIYSLHRIQFGSRSLGDLKPGEWR
ncbi:MAG TPA: pseudouridine synthase [Candidatus Absconditabacterales bacterium]|nr:pseudouridine synthase [Candidatus Absconditabacterales bacterium]HNG97662.1 pseudouridine synthase [Candidatus Absconditabacterales bacterium]